MGVRSVCLGVGPLAELGQVEGFGGVTEFLARGIYRWVTKVMSLHDRTAFWEKYHVAYHEPLYLLSSRGILACANSTPYWQLFIFPRPDNSAYGLGE